MKRVSVWFTLGLLLQVAACSGKEKVVTVTGKVIRAGQPQVHSDQRILQIVFMPDVPPQSVPRTHPATLERGSDTYTVELPPGRYRIGVQQFDASNPTKDLLNGAYHPDRSPLVKEISGEQELNLEVQ